MRIVDAAFVRMALSATISSDARICRHNCPVSARGQQCAYECAVAINHDRPEFEHLVQKIEVKCEPCSQRRDRAVLLRRSCYIRHRTYLVSIPGMFGNRRKISSAFTLLTLNGTSDSMMVVAHARTMWVTSPSSFVVFIRQVDPVP